MKKSLVALAALAVAGAASAQSSVTLFGVVDTAISGYTSKSETPLGVSVTKSQTALSSSGYNSSRLGFRGTEDLGGGLAASFWLEAGMDTSTGAGGSNSPYATGGGLNFNRRSTVSLSGNFGELRLGRDYTPSFWNDTVFDPFGTNGVGTSLIFTANGGTNLGVPGSGFQTNGSYVRANNSVQYFLPPNLGGFYGQFMYAFNERTNVSPGCLTPAVSATGAAIPSPCLTGVASLANTGNDPAGTTRAGAYAGGRVGYTTGPLDVALSYAQSTIASNYFVGSTTKLDIWNLGASYDFGVVKLFGEYSNNKQNTDLVYNQLNAFGTVKPGANGGLIGVTVPVGAGLIRASYSAVKYNNLSTTVNGVTVPYSWAGLSEPKADQFAIGYVYNLSKRTAVYATYAYIKNDNGAALAVQNAPAFYTGTIPGATGAAVPKNSQGYDLGIRHSF